LKKPSRKESTLSFLDYERQGDYMKEIVKIKGHYHFSINKINQFKKKIEAFLSR